jgi:branched-chain amino acid transport system substrate-binding protein
MRPLPFLAFALGLVAHGALAQGVTDTEVKIGGSTALTGPGALVGIAHDLGEKIATAEINAAGGINGRKVVRVFEDDGYVPARTVTTVRKLLDVDKVLAITASSGTASTLAALPMMEEQGVPALQTAAPNTVMFSPMHKTLFVIGRAYGPGTTDFVKFLAARKPGAKFLAIVQDDDYGDDVQSGYEAAVTELKLTSVGVLRYKRGQKDFAAEILKAKQLGATIIVSGGIIAENVTIAKEAKRVGLEAEIAMLWSGRLPQTIDLMGEAGNGIIAADYVGDFDEGAGKALFEKARLYLTAEELTKLNRYSLTGYVGARLMFDAIARCGRDVTRACVTAKLETTSNLDMGG